MKPKNLFPVSPPPQGTVVYDGTCRFCEAFMGYSKNKGASRGLKFVASQLVDLNTLSPSLTQTIADRSLIFVRRDGKRFQGAGAVYELLRNLPGLWRVLGTFMACATLTKLSEPFYRAVASNRHYLSRKLGMEEYIAKTTDTSREDSSE